MWAWHAMRTVEAGAASIGSGGGGGVCSSCGAQSPACMLCLLSVVPDGQLQDGIAQQQHWASTRHLDTTLAMQLVMNLDHQLKTWMFKAVSCWQQLVACKLCRGCQGRNNHLA